MEHPINPTKALKLFELGSDTFQRLCRAMFRELPEVMDAKIYGKNGQPQRGIDIEATLKSGPRWVGQCKACEGQPKHVRKNFQEAVKEFEPHIAYWKSQGATKFIVLFGCGVEDPQTLDQKRHCEREYREKHGIEFELWDSDDIGRCLQNMRKVVDDIIRDPWWTEKICGRLPEMSEPPRGSAVGQSSLVRTIVADLEIVHNDRLDQIRDKIHLGSEAEAELSLRELMASSSWAHLDARLRARAWRMLMVVVLNRREDVVETEALLARAITACPGERFEFVETAIRFHKEGPHAALAAMPEPVNRDEWNLKTWLTLITGQVEGAMRQLEAPPFGADAETHRLRGLGDLLRGNHDAAAKAASEAEALSPERRSVQELAGMVDYLAAISPAFEQWTFLAWPVPPPWHMVKQDAGSLAALHRAGERFGNLAQKAISGGKDWLRAMSWRLACLGNDPARRDEAQTLLDEVLAADAAFVPAIVWATKRGFIMDQVRCKAALEARCRHEQTTVEPVQAWISLLAEERQFLPARDVLRAHRGLFERLHLLDIWHFQNAQIHVTLADEATATAALNDIGDPDMRGQTQVAIATMTARRSGWTPELAAVLNTEYERTSSPDALFRSCEAHLEAGKTEYVVARAGSLLTGLATEAALRLIIEATAQSRRWDECLAVMQEHRPLFKGGEFPPAIRRLRVKCLERLGRLPEAESEARALSQAQGGTEDRWGLFHLQWSTGKIPEATVTAKTLLQDPNVTTEGLLLLAEKLRPEAPELARTFYKQALQQEIGSLQTSVNAVQIGFKLGLEELASPLLQRLVNAVGSEASPLKALAPVQLFEFLQGQARHQVDVESKYRAGLVHLHAYAEHLNAPLVTFLWAETAANEDSDTPPHRTWSLQMRHASRRGAAKLSSTAKHGLFLDITSLLIAAHLEVLGALEAEFSPIGISPRVFDALGQQIDHVTDGQPSRIPPKREVLDLIGERRLAILGVAEFPNVETHELCPLMGAEWCALLEHARNAGGWLVDFLPLTSHDERMAPAPVRDTDVPYVKGCRDVLSALVASGALSLEQEHTALLRLDPGRAAVADTTDLGENRVVVLESGIAEHLAEAGILRVLTKKARVQIREDEASRLQLESQNWTHREHIAYRLRDLRERLRSGMDNGLYEMKPNASLHDHARGEFVSADSLCLIDFVNQTRAASELSCCDDRAITRFRKVGESPIVGLFDLLWFLMRKGRISEATLYTCLHRLRRSNARYLPISTEEMVFHLSKATLKNGNVVETEELATLRRYVSGCLLDFDALQQLPPRHPEALEASEQLFFVPLQQNIAEALITLWRQPDAAREMVKARSEWLLNAMWFDLAALPTFSASPRKPTVALFGDGVAYIIIRSLSVRPRRGESETTPKREEFLAWLLPQFGTDPGRRETLATDIKRQILDLVRSLRNPQERRAGRLMGGEFLQSLPTDLRHAIKLTKSELAEFGLTRFHPVEFDGVIFDARDFFPSAERALLGQPSKLKAKAAGGEHTVSLDSTCPTLAIMIRDSSGREFRVSAPVLRILVPGVQAREHALHDMRQDLDVPARDAAAKFAKLARIKRADLRAREFAAVCDKSLSCQLRDVTRTLESQRQFDIRLAQPESCGAAMRHLRFVRDTTKNAFSSRLDDAAKTMLADEGLEEAFERSASLPVLLPPCIHAEFASLPPDVRAAFVARLQLEPAAPLLRFHAIGLLLRGSVVEQETAVELFRSLTSSAALASWTLLEAILDWTHSWLAKAECGRTKNAGEVIAASWIHAARLHQLLAGGTDAAELARFFQAHQRRDATGAFDPSHAEPLDAASPGRFSATRLLVLGISHYLQGVRLDDGIAEKLKDAINELAFPYRQPNAPALKLWEQRVTLQNVLESFLGSCCDATLAGLIGPEHTSLFSDAKLEEDVNTLLKTISADPAKLESWIVLSAHLSGNPPTDSQRPGLLHAFDVLSFKQFQSPTIEQLQAIALLFFNQTKHLGEASAAARWQSKLVELTEVLADTERSYPVPKAAILLCECAYTLAVTAPTEEEAARRFGESLALMAQAWPAAAGFFVEPTIRILLLQPERVQASMWRGACAVRSVARRLQPNVHQSRVINPVPSHRC